MNRRSVNLFLVALLAAVAVMVPGESEAVASDCTNTYIPGQTPLPDLATATYQGAQGGLYPGGANVIPAEHLELGRERATNIRALDLYGEPDPNGAVVIVSVGVSNTAAEFQPFIGLLSDHPKIRPEVVAVDGAQGGAPVSSWIDPAAPTWGNLRVRVLRQGFSSAQVQAAWIKLPEKDPTEPFPTDAATYRDDLSQVVRNLKTHFPNTQIAHISSRIYAGYGTEISPEPWAYQHGFGVKWTIENQIRGSGALNADPDVGPVLAPWLTWGPYLWANGLGPDGVEGGEPGRADGLEWLCSDFRLDGIHPSDSGAGKVAEGLLDHLIGHPTSCGWLVDEECFGTGEPAPAMHVGAIGVAIETSGSRATGTATTRVVDEDLNRVSGVTVTGDWFHDSLETQSGQSATTDDTGRATIVSGAIDEVAAGDLITFCVTGLTHPSLSYDPAANTETCQRVKVG